MLKLKTSAGALTLVLLASCGGSAKKAAPVAPPVSLAIATTRAATSVAATTVPPSTAPKPSTTVAPTTTTMSLVDLEKVVRQAHADYWVAALRCIGAPGACDPTTFTAADSPLRAKLFESSKELTEKKWIARQNESDPATAVIDSIAFNDKRTVATLKECLWDTGIAIQPNAGPNGEDIIVDDSKLSAENTVTVVLSDGRWLLSDRREIARHEGVNQCIGR